MIRLHNRSHTRPAHGGPLMRPTSLSPVRVRLSPSDEKVPPRTISNETLFIGLASKAVSGVIGPYDIDEISDKLVKFSVGSRDQGAYSEGSFDRYSGSWRQRSMATSRSAEAMLSPASPLSRARSRDDAEADQRLHRAAIRAIVLISPLVEPVWNAGRGETVSAVLTPMSGLKRSAFRGGFP